MANTSKWLVTSVVAICMGGGVPASEYFHEGKKNGHYEALPPGNHEHIPQENNTEHVGVSYTDANSTSTPVGVRLNRLV
jgi:hypothetical protein